MSSVFMTSAAFASLVNFTLWARNFATGPEVPGEKPSTLLLLLRLG